jgi:hypothetical protein
MPELREGSDAAVSDARAPFQLSGAVQKGPFVLGSSVQVSSLDNDGSPTGDVFPTKTNDNLGGFALTVNPKSAGALALEGTGFYYNESTGKLSDAALTLRAFYDLKEGGNQSAYINIVTHLTYDRVLKLVKGPPTVSFAAAVAQAEKELRTALGIGGRSFDPKASGVSMNVVGGDSDANAYLFGVSAILAEIATRAAAGASVDAQLQQLINTVSSSFALTGQVSASLVDQIANVQQTVDPQALMDKLKARLTEVGSTAVVPDLNRIWDTDGDGIPNAIDNCPLIANADQAPLNDVCRITIRKFDASCGAALGDFTGDGKLDIIGWTRNNGAPNPVTVYAGDGKGGLSPILTPAPTVGVAFDHGCAWAGLGGRLDGYFPLAADVDKDGSLDILAASYSASGTHSSFFPGDGAGHLASGEKLFTETGYDQLRNIVVADFDGDGLNDLVGTRGYPSKLSVMRGTGARSWAAPVDVALPSNVIVYGLVGGDFNMDGKMDVAFASYEEPGTSTGGVFVLLGTGATTAPFFTLAAGNPLTTAGTRLRGIYADDIDGDGKTDLLVASGDVTILVGDGAGQFGSPTVLPGAGTTAYQFPVWMRVADFTGDGKADVATWVNHEALRVFVKTTTGYSAGSVIPRPWLTRSTDGGGVPFGIGDEIVLVGDLTGDGVADIVWTTGVPWSPVMRAILINTPP